MRLSKAELMTLLRALDGAERDSADLIRCHTSHGKSIDPKVTRDSRAFLKRIAKLRKKVFAFLHPGKKPFNPWEGAKEMTIQEFQRLAETAAEPTGELHG